MMPIPLIRKSILCCVFCGFVINVYAQQTNSSTRATATDTVKNLPDSVFVPLKYCDIHKRSPVLACALSLFIPGLGQVYNKQVGKGAILFGISAISLGAASIHYANNVLHPHDGATVALLVPLFAAYVYSAIDAPVTASWLNKTYHLGKQKRSFTSLHISPGLINTSSSKYAGGISLILR